MDLRHNPPENEMPGVIGFGAVLGRTDRAAVAIAGALAFSAGIEFKIEIAVRRVDPEKANVVNDVLFGGRRSGDTADALLLGVEFSDGRRASNFGEPWMPTREILPNQPTLWPGGGGGSATRQSLSFWLHPAPPPGDLIFVAAWPALGIAETRTVIAADAIAAGVAGVVELWPWEPPPDDEEVPRPRPSLAPGSWFADPE